MPVALSCSTSDDFDTTALRTWQRALELWQIGWTTVDLSESPMLNPQETPLLVIDGFGRSVDVPWATLSAFVRCGGSVIVAGMPGFSSDEPPSGFTELAGICSIVPGREEFGWPALMVETPSPALAPWARGDVLFFTTPAFDRRAAGLWGRIVELADPAPEVLATVYWTDVLPQPGVERFAGHPSSDPALVAYRPHPSGGVVLYTPLPLGLIRSVLPPQVVEVDLPPGPVDNQGMLLLLRTLTHHALKEGCCPLPELALWPDGASGVLCLTGDVHEFNDSPSGSARREFQYISRMADLVNERGLGGKFTFYVTGLLAENHHEVLRDHKDWDFGGHTYRDTMYVDRSRGESQPHTGSPASPDQTAGRDAQSEDVALSISALAHVLPGKTDRGGNWRTHYYSSTATTREVLAEHGVRWLSDMGMYWPGEWQTDRFGYPLITYVSYPQQALGTRGQELPLWEMGETVPSDYALWVSGTRHPQLPWSRDLSGEEAAQVWIQRLERAWRAEELCVINWHPFHSLQTAERADALRHVMDFAQQLPGLAVMTMSEAGGWWDARSQVRMKVVARDGESLRLTLHNCGNGEISGVTVRLWVPKGRHIDQLTIRPCVEAREAEVDHSPTHRGWAGIRLTLSPGEHVEMTVPFGVGSGTPGV